MTYHTKEKIMARTIGSKDKKPRARKPRTTKPAISFVAQLDQWDQSEQKSDFQELCEKLQSALAKSYVECDLLEATVSEQRTIIKYLESKVREAPTV